MASPWRKSGWRSSGSRAANDFAATAKAAESHDETKAEEPLAARPLPDMVKVLAAELRDYQNAAFSAHFEAQVAKIAAAERRVDPASQKLARAFALNSTS